VHWYSLALNLSPVVCWWFHWLITSKHHHARFHITSLPLPCIPYHSLKSKAASPLSIQRCTVSTSVMPPRPSHCSTRSRITATHDSNSSTGNHRNLSSVFKHCAKNSSAIVVQEKSFSTKHKQREILNNLIACYSFDTLGDLLVCL